MARTRPALPIFKYHGTTVYFKFADETDLAEDNDAFQVSAFEDKRQAGTAESQIVGPLRAFFFGNTFIHKEGIFREQHSPTSLNVSLSGFEGVIEKVSVGGLVEEATWSGLSPIGTNYLWASLIEEDEFTGEFVSSRMKSEWEALFTPSVTPPASRQSALMATFTSGVGIDPDPVGKLGTVPSLGGHVQDSQNPHGTTLFQDEMVASGVEIPKHVVFEEFLQSGELLPFLQAGDFVGMGTQHMLISGIAIVSGTMIFHGDLTLSGGNITDQGALLDAMDRVSRGTIGALTVTSGLDVISGPVFNEDISILSGLLWDGVDISAQGERLDAHLLDFANPHMVLSGQVSGEFVTELGGVVSGEILMLSGLAVDGVDFSELIQFIDGTEINQQTHLHTTASGIQFLGIAPESTAIEVFTGQDDVFYSQLSGANVGILSGSDSVLIAHMRKYVPEDFGSPIRATFKHGIQSSLSGLDSVFGGSYGQADLDATLPIATTVMNFNELGGDVATGDRQNLLKGGVPTEMEEYTTGSTTVPAADGVILSGADFESGGTSVVLRPKDQAGEVFLGVNFVNISLFVIPESTFSTHYILSEASAAGTSAPRLAIVQTSDNRIQILHRRTDGVNRTFQTAASVINDGVVNHIGLMLDLVTEEIEVYHDGVLEINGGVPGSGSLDNVPRTGAGVGLQIGARAEASFGSGPVFTYDGVIDILNITVGQRLNSDHFNEYNNSGVGIEFQPVQEASLSMQVRDSDGGILLPLESKDLREDALTETSVDLFSENIRPNTFMELQYAISGAVAEAVFFGPWSLQYAPSSLPQQHEAAGLGIGSTGEG